MDCFEAQKVIAQRRGNAVVVTAGTCVREWPQISDTDMDLPCAGAMGKAAVFGLGLALALPSRKVIVLDSDGGLLMNLGSLVTIANMAPPNLLHFVFNNGVWRGSGGQPIPSAGKISFKGLAEAAGYRHSYLFEDLDDLKGTLAGVMGQTGPTLVCLKVPPLTKSPPFPFAYPPTTIPRFRAFREAIQQRQG
ncbi:MAG: thiamine pyrophosphate-binding protein [Chloroflexi bacterium]|nr:thiamine pyrophosphate-binding protein [Chloroflexota bacterium]